MKKILLLAFLFAFTKSFSQTTLTLQPNASTGKDAYIWSLDPNGTNSTTEDLALTAWTWSGNPGTIRSLLQFDLSSIPAGATIQTASMYLYWNPTSGNAGQSHLSGSNAAWLQRITSSWNDQTVTWNNQPSTTTLHQATLPADTASNEDYVVNVTSLIQDMVDNPSTSFGFLLRIQTEQYYRALVFASSNHPNAALHPKLVVTYTVPACTNLILQPNAAEGKDAYIWSLDPDGTNSTTEDLALTAWTWSGNPGTIRSLLQFDLSSIPAGATIQTATMYLYWNPTSGNAGQSHLSGSDAAWLQRITSSWNDQTVTWNNQPSTTNLHQATLPADTASNEDYVVNVASLIQDMVDSPSTSFGFLLRIQTEQYYRALVFASSNHPTAALHPKLEICYTTNIGILENSLSSQISIYPNPSNGSFAISFQNLLKNGSLKVFNSLGQEVYSEKLSGSISKKEINLNAAAGIYFVKVSDGEKVFTRKLVIQ
jgi:hypothetical protein